MATSSFTKNFKIPADKVDEFLEAMENSKPNLELMNQIRENLEYKDVSNSDELVKNLKKKFMNMNK